MTAHSPGVLPHATSDESAQELAEYAAPIKQIRGFGESFGLSFYEILFRRATQDNLSFMASFGLPNRFSHWYFGGMYKNLKIQQDENLLSILELVLNTDPVYAFLLDTNSHLENLMVIAHVMGHVDFFRNNAWYQRSDRDMLNKCEQHARRMRELTDTVGKELVDDAVEAILTIANTVNVFERDPKKRQHRLVYFLQDQLRARLEAQLDPPERESHLKAVLAILTMVCEEIEYFDLIGRTQIINEGWASFVEFKILEKLLGAKEWLEFTFQFSKRPAPYLIGFTLFNDNFKKGGWAQVLEIRKVYEDIAFVDRFLTQKLSQELDLFVVERDNQERDYSVKRVKEKIIEEKDSRGQPQVVVKDFDAAGAVLTLENPDVDRLLEKKRTELFLKKLTVLWPYEIVLIDGETSYRSRSGAVTTEKR